MNPKFRIIQVILFALSISVIGAFDMDQLYAKAQKIDPDKVDYHLKLAQGILETCYTRDDITDKLIPNPTLPILSNMAKTCDKKMTTLDSFLAQFVDDKDGKAYDEHVANNNKSNS